MTDTARVLLTSGVLSGVAFGYFAWRLTASDRAAHERLIGQLRLSQWAALLLAASGAIYIGLSVAAERAPEAYLEAIVGLATILVGAVVLHREPREALLVAAGAFAVHALIDISHRPGLLSPDLAPRWYAIGCAIYDVYLAAVCYWGRRLKSDT